MADKIKTVQEGHIVQDFKVGATRIKIADDYCRDKTKEDVEKILRDLARQLLPYFSVAAPEKGIA